MSEFCRNKSYNKGSTSTCKLYLGKYIVLETFISLWIRTLETEKWREKKRTLSLPFTKTKSLTRISIDVLQSKLDVTCCRNTLYLSQIEIQSFNKVFIKANLCLIFKTYCINVYVVEVQPATWWQLIIVAI